MQRKSLSQLIQSFENLTGDKIDCCRACWACQGRSSSRPTWAPRGVPRSISAISCRGRLPHAKPDDWLVRVWQIIKSLFHSITIAIAMSQVTFWDYGNGFTDTFQHGGSSFPYPGTYIVKVFGMCSNGSIDSSVHTVLVDYPNNIICNFITSDNISEQSNHKFSAFPNPFNDQLHFDNPSEEGYIKIYNTLGNQVLFKKIGTGLVNLDVSLLIDGIYFLHYFDGILSKKLF